MTYNEALAEILTWITDNDNKEITAAIMRDVLTTLLDYSAENIGDTDNLFAETNTVDAINALKSLIDGIDLTLGLQVHNGTANPNITPPSGGYDAPDIYVREDDALKEVYLFNGISWVQIINFSFPIYEEGIFKGNARSLDFSGGNFNLTYDSITGVMTVEVTGEGVAKLEDVGDVPAYPNDGQEWVLVELDGDLTWELKGSGGGITESDVIGTPRQYTAGQGTALGTLTIAAGSVTPDIAAKNAYSLDIDQNVTINAPTNDRCTSWFIHCEITGAGGWTIGLNSAYKPDGGAALTIPNTTGDKFTLYVQSFGDGTHDITIHTQQ